MKFLQNPAVRLSVTGPPYAFNKGHTSQYIGVVLIFLAFAFSGIYSVTGSLGEILHKLHDYHDNNYLCSFWVLINSGSRPAYLLRFVLLF